MEIKLNFDGTGFIVDLNKPINISIPLQSGSENPNCFGAPFPIFEPLRAPGFVGDTRLGGAVNFFDVQMNPHGNGTHTECVGHIAKERIHVSDCLTAYHSIGLLITVSPQTVEQDRVVTKKILEAAIINSGVSKIQTLILRTLPNTTSKLNQNYTGTNPAFFSAEAMEFLIALGVEHLIVDLPSVDKEQDGGKLNAHHIFWQFPLHTRINATITEMVFVDNAISDGLYFVNLQISPICLDASSSTVLLFALRNIPANGE